MTTARRLSLKIYPPYLAERIISAAFVYPHIKLTGAEIAVMLGCLDELDEACIDVLHELFGVAESKKLYLEKVRRVLKKKGHDFEAEEVVERLRDLGILHFDYSKKVYYVPNEIRTTISIENDTSLVLFYNKKAKKYMKFDGVEGDCGKFKIDALPLGYAFCKVQRNTALSLARKIARELSSLDPDTVIRPEYFKLVTSGRDYKICEECFLRKSEKDWAPVGWVVLRACKLYSTKWGKEALAILRGKHCRRKAERSRELEKSSDIELWKVRKKLSEIEHKVVLKSMKITYLPMNVDTSFHYAVLPEEVFIDEDVVCGLALSLAAHWYDPDTFSKEGNMYGMLLYAVSGTWPVVSTDLTECMEFLARIVKERNELLQLSD